MSAATRCWEVNEEYGTCSYDIGIYARYVRMHSNDMSHVALAEVEVYGYCKYCLRSYTNYFSNWYRNPRQVRVMLRGYWAVYFGLLLWSAEVFQFDKLNIRSTYSIFHYCPSHTTQIDTWKCILCYCWKLWMVVTNITTTSFSSWLDRNLSVGLF